MMADAEGPLATALPMAIMLLCASLVLAFVRLARGPSLPDRVVALDLIAVLVVGMIAVLTIRTNSAEVLRAAIVLALVSFLGTIAFARYVEKRRAP